MNFSIIILRDSNKFLHMQFGRKFFSTIRAKNGIKKLFCMKVCKILYHAFWNNQNQNFA